MRKDMRWFPSIHEVERAAGLDGPVVTTDTLWFPDKAAPTTTDMREPTLVDAMIRRTFVKQDMKYINPKGDLRGMLQRARKFVLTREMSAMLTDLAWSPLVVAKGNEPRLHQYMEGMRAHARAPHALTWIEYDAKAKIARRNEYTAELDKRYGKDLAEGPDRCGWLIEQLTPTIYRATEFASHAWDEQKRIASPQPTAFSMVWSVADDDLSSLKFDLDDVVQKTMKGISDKYVHTSAWLTGVPNYVTPHVATGTSFCTPGITKLYLTGEINTVIEQASDLRYLWAFLATINRLPTTVTETRQSKGFVAKGTYRKFVDHHTIHIKVPATRYRVVARHAMAITRRKRHEVRGHFRRDWRHPPTPLCDHEWYTAESGHTACKRCEGRRLYIPPHERGDATLGYAMHDYIVER